MGNPVFVRTADGRLMSVYHASEGVCARVFESGGWSRQKVLLPEGRDSFTVSMAEDGRVLLFAEGGDGDMRLCTEENSGWAERPVLRGAGLVKDSPVCALLSGAEMQLLYAASGEGKNRLMSQMLGARARAAGAPVDLGSAEPLSGRLFQLRHVGHKHALLLYLSREPERGLGYREVTPARIGEFRLLHATGYRITDASFLAAPDTLHALFIVKSPFACQLIYRCVDDAGLSEPLVLREGQRMEHCLLYAAGGRLTACCLCGGQLFTNSVRESPGYPLPRMRPPFLSEPVKAQYLAPPDADGDAFACGELYADKVRPWEPRLLDIPPEAFFR